MEQDVAQLCIEPAEANKLDRATLSSFRVSWLSTLGRVAFRETGRATMNYTESTLWQTAFKEEKLQGAEARDRFKQAYLRLREKAQILVSLIIRDMPDYTVHDVSHLDALWEVGSQIAGPDYPLNPAEAFVLGGAILLHDAAMTLAAFPGGLEELRRTPEWGDADVLLGKDQQEEIKEREARLLTEVLRRLHAKQARRLAIQSWHGSSGESEEFLIDDVELRDLYGETIGLVAESHWFSVGQLERELTREMGALPAGPSDWTVDVLKVACLLRVSDAAHIDTRRAPRFMRVITAPTGVARDHWLFQGRLHRPTVRSEALSYSSGRAFSGSETDSWWVCFDAIQMVDGELRNVDALLASTNRRRFSARRVEGAESPRALARFIQTHGWEPVDTQIRVSDVPGLVRMLGGKQLYGDDPSVPLRELLQNAADAVRARRKLARKHVGRIDVRLMQVESDFVLEVEDDGIGMSEYTLLNGLIDFGKSFWKSEGVRVEFPGLAASGLVTSGQFGIGFFATFMVGDSVAVFTKRYDKGGDQALSLQFEGGLARRPVLRRNLPGGFVENGGTCVQVKLSADPVAPGGLLSMFRTRGDLLPSLKDLVTSLCPCVDVDVFVDGVRAIEAGDWLRIKGSQLIQRVDFAAVGSRFDASYDRLVRPIAEPDGEVVGRATAVCMSWQREGLVIDSGFKVCSIAHVAGMLVGNVQNASRTEARPIASSGALENWANEQSRLIQTSSVPDFAKFQASAVIVCLGGDPRSLPIVQVNGSYLSSKEFRKYIIDNDLSEICVVGENSLLYDSDDDCSESAFDNRFELSESVIVTPDLPSIRAFGGRSWPVKHARLAGLCSKDRGMIAAELVVRKVWKEKLDASSRQFSIGEVDGEDIDRFGVVWKRQQP